ncbi:MAG: cache domain-containing protein [Planctomycetaceae bacterium]|jgi:sensor histidine kinase regulating citrate/malate metabolism|nr:cache domain-containing protein [Planctomycetaceae bacterium]
MKRFHGIQAKILFRVIIMTIALVIITLSYSTYSFRSYVQQTANKDIQAAAQDIISEVKMLQNLALEQAQALSFKKEILEGIQKNDRDVLFKICGDYQSGRKADSFTICDAAGTIVLRSRDRAKFGDSQADLDTVKAAMSGKAAVQYSTTKGIPLSIRAAAPVFDADNKVAGIVASNFRLDVPEWCEHLKKRYHVENTTFVGKMRVMTTLVKDDGQLAIGTELADPNVIKTIFEEKKDYPGESKVLGRQMKVYYYPIVEKGETIAILFAGLPIDEANQLVTKNFYENLLIAAVVMVVFVFMLIINSRAIVNPIRQIAVAAKELADGKLDIELDVRTGDETQMLAEDFINMAATLKAKVNVAKQIAGGDLTIWVPLSSEEDERGGWHYLGQKSV